MILHALSWLDRGFPVFPLRPRGKEPCHSLIRHGLKDASRDQHVVRDWWRLEPASNIGIVTGGGRFVLDLDDAEAVSWFTNETKRHGAPKTLTVRTARGFHLFFACSDSIPNSAGRLAPGVDVRGEGGYVVAAPSVHPDGIIYTIVRDLPIANAPQWLLRAALPPVIQASVMPAMRKDGGLQCIAGIVLLVANAPKGKRNQIVFWAACRLSEMVREGSITEGLARDILLQSAIRCGLPATEVLRTAASASRIAGR